MTTVGWQSVLRGYVSATGLTDAIESGLKSVLWMYIPDFDRGGQMHEIRNLTNQISNYTQVWDDLDYIRNITEDDYKKSLAKPQLDALDRLGL